jgi:hypothetical protein
MLLAVAVALFVLWLLCVLVFKITFGLLHLLLVLAVISLVLHFVRKGRNAMTR